MHGTTVLPVTSDSTIANTVRARSNYTFSDCVNGWVYDSLCHCAVCPALLSPVSAKFSRSIFSRRPAGAEEIKPCSVVIILPLLHLLACNPEMPCQITA